jgi:hypothetical protein
MSMQARPGTRKRAGVMTAHFRQERDARPTSGLLATTGEKPMQWEYYRLSVDGPNVETALHELGQNGWELVAVIPETRIFFGFQCFLKRPLSNNGPAAADRSAEPRRLDNYLSVRSSTLGRPNREGDSPDDVRSVTWQR